MRMATCVVLRRYDRIADVFVSQCKPGAGDGGARAFSTQQHLGYTAMDRRLAYRRADCDIES